MKLLGSFLICTFVLFGANPVSAANEESEENITLIGQHFNEDYLFVLNPVWEDVTGSWGRNQYVLAWDSDFKILSGKTAGVSHEVEFSAELLEVYGDVGCGWVDLSFTNSAPWSVEGRFCLEDKIQMTFDSQALMNDWLESKVSREMVVEFPEPTREEVFEFLKRLIEI